METLAEDILSEGGLDIYVCVCRCVSVCANETPEAKSKQLQGEYYLMSSFKSTPPCRLELG